jgi:hypothetical protein
MSLGREEMILAGRLVSAMERQADANEALIALAKEEREKELSGPPTCPHCGYVNPSIQARFDGSGPLGDFVLAATCNHCEKVFYAEPINWFVTDNPEEFERAD